MTCIVGLEHDGDVYIGGDSAGVGGYSLSVRSDSKVFRNGPFAMGFTSSFRMGQLLRYKFSPPEQLPSEDDDKFLVTRFMDAVRQCLKDGGYAETNNGVEKGGVFLFGYRGRLYRVNSDFQVGRNVLPYDAVGCGQDVALGAMGASTIPAPEARIQQALRISEQHSAGVRGPFSVVSTRSEG